MKRVLWLTLLLAGFGGCKKSASDLIQGKTADERLAATLAAWQSKLMGSTTGWMLLEVTTGSAINQGATSTGQQAAFAFYMQFTDSNKVTMFGDFDSAMTVTPKQSSWRVKGVQRPSLIFDTYSYIHVPADPNPEVSQSPFGAGLGWGADFEFSFADSTDPSAVGDTIQLTGNLNGATAILVKATQAQHDAYYNGKVSDDLAISSIQNYFKHLVFSGTTLEITPSVYKRMIDVSIGGAAGEKTYTTPYYFFGSSVRFTNPIAINGTAIYGIDNLSFDRTTMTATATVNGKPATLAGAVAPLYYDPNSLYNWYVAAANAGSLYFSYTGFHIDGVDDALGVTQVTDNGNLFYAYVYYPAVIDSVADVFSPFFYSPVNGSGSYPEYTTISQPFYGPTGLARFQIDTVVGTPPAPIAASNAVLTNSTGFYLIEKEDGTSYDMVEATDAKTWISWTLAQ